MSLHFPTIELKDADPVDAVTAALDELTKSVDDRLKAIETKSAGVDDLASLRTAIDELKAAQAKTDTKLARPGIIPDRKADDGRTIEQKAFETFLRKGENFVPEIEKKALVTATDTAAGYLVAPTQLVAEILTKVEKLSPMRGLVVPQNTSSPSVTFPRETAVPEATWIEEDEEVPETGAEFGMQTINISDLGAWAPATTRMLEDSAFNIEAYFVNRFAKAFARAEALAFVNGTGVKQPRGFMNNPTVADIAGGDATDLTGDALIDVYHSIHSAYIPGSVWAMNRKTMAAVRKLKAGDGNYLWSDSFSADNPPTILGRPVVEFPDMPDIGAGARPIAFGDFGSAYRIFDRPDAVSFLRDPYTCAKRNIVLFHARRRVGGDVVMGEALRTLKIATTV